MKVRYNRPLPLYWSLLVMVLLTGSAGQAFGKTSGVSRVHSVSPTKKIITVSSDKESVISMAGGRGSAPYVAFPFISQGAVSYTVTRLSPETFRLGGLAMPAVDSAEGSNAIARANFQSLGDANGVLLKQVGIMRGEKLFSLIVLPYQYDSTTGRVTYFKTINVTLSSNAAFPSTFDNLPEALTRDVANQVQSNTPIPSGNYIRIVVDQDGIYHITGEELDTAGVDLSGFTSKNMTLWNHGKQIPIYVHTVDGNAFTKSGYFEFYGTANRVDYSQGRPDLYLDPFSNDNVYFLTRDSTGPAQRLNMENGALGHAGNAVSLADYSFTENKHLEVDRVFERLDAVDLNEPYDREDHWFWTEVSSQQMATEPFYLAYPDTTSIQPLTLTAAFQGITHFDIPDEHQAELFINSTHVLSSNWVNQTTNIVNVGVSANIPQNVLHNGYNSFEIYNANPGNVDVCTFTFNWVELHYQRLYVAHNDYLKFTVPDNAQPGYYDFVIEHFKNSNITVYRLNDSRITNVTIKHLNNQGTAQGYAALFEAYVQSPADQFIAVSDSGKLNPVKIEVVPRAGLASHDYSANYIIIASRQLDNVSGKQFDQSNPVSKLASWYNSHGVRTMVVNAVQVYDAFNYGIESPHAIKSFISYAY
ncbi:MAG: C25 family cysteine peptidase, partial [Bacteroidetes bacterium]|nr:C25 family cysteine peptidase [Bacteroidota bacterium]